MVPPLPFGRALPPERIRPSEFVPEYVLRGVVRWRRSVSGVVGTGVKAPLPGFVEPALASQIERVPSGERWIHEIKFDGYRVQVHLANEAVTIFTRRGHDWTRRFKKVADDASSIKGKFCGWAISGCL